MPVNMILCPYYYVSYIFLGGTGGHTVLGARVFDRSNTSIVGSNSAPGMDVYPCSPLFCCPV